MSRLRKLLTLQPAERRALLGAALLLPIVHLGLVVLPFRTLRRLLALPERARAPAPRNGRLTSDGVVRAVIVASRYLPGTRSCLTQALTALLLLRRHGYPAVLRIGVARPDDSFRAHAWVESEGRVVFGEASLSQYTPLPALP